MANITVTEAAGFIPEIWAATALGVLKANTVMAGLVNRNFESLIANQGDVINVPRRGTLTVNDKAANTEITLQTPTADTIPLTLNKYKEVSFLVEDVAAAQANQSIVQGYVEDGMIALAEQIDSDILALYSGFSTTPVDATGGPSTLDGVGVRSATIIEANRLLNVAKAPKTDRYIVWHPNAEAELLDKEKITSADFGDPGTAVREATIGRKYGFTHFMSQNVPTAGGECKNFAFHRNAIMMATRSLPLPPNGSGAISTVMSEDGIGLRVMYAYDIRYKGMIVSIDCLYGVAEMRDPFGVVIRSTDY